MKPGRAREIAEKAAGEIYYDVDLMSNSHPRNVDVIESAIQTAVGEFAEEAAKKIETEHAENACCAERVRALKKRWASKGEVSE